MSNEINLPQAYEIVLVAKSGEVETVVVTEERQKQIVNSLLTTQHPGHYLRRVVAQDNQTLWINFNNVLYIWER